MLQPSEQWLNEYEKQVGGERVPLNCAELWMGMSSVSPAGMEILVLAFV